jgi:hypothetical protein
MLEMTKLIPSIVRDFDFELVGEHSSTVSPWNTENYWFVKPTNFRVKIRARRGVPKT